MQTKTVRLFLDSQAVEKLKELGSLSGLTTLAVLGLKQSPTMDKILYHNYQTNIKGKCYFVRVPSAICEDLPTIAVMGFHDLMPNKSVQLYHTLTEFINYAVLKALDSGLNVNLGA